MYCKAKTINVNLNLFPETTFAPVHGNQVVVERNFFKNRISGHSQLIEETCEYLSKVVIFQETYLAVRKTQYVKLQFKLLMENTSVLRLMDM